jgi:hypothetical protein
MKKFGSVIFVIGWVSLLLYHLYTAFAAHIEYGFSGAAVAFCLPVLSSIWMNIVAISRSGFTQYTLIAIIILAILALGLLLSNGKEKKNG